MDSCLFAYYLQHSENANSTPICSHFELRSHLRPSLLLPRTSNSIIPAADLVIEQDMQCSCHRLHPCKMDHSSSAGRPRSNHAPFSDIDLNPYTTHLLPVPHPRDLRVPHLLLQLENTVHQCLTCWGASRHVNIDWHDSIASSCNTIAVVVISTAVGARTHGDDPSGLKNLLAVVLLYPNPFTSSIPRAFDRKLDAKQEPSCS